jgi:hypothetical protein
MRLHDLVMQPCLAAGGTRTLPGVGAFPARMLTDPEASVLTLPIPLKDAGALRSGPDRAHNGSTL